MRIFYLSSQVFILALVLEIFVSLNDVRKTMKPITFFDIGKKRRKLAARV